MVLKTSQDGSEINKRRVLCYCCKPMYVASW